MKNFWKPPFSINEKAKKLILTMKLTVFMLFLTLMQVSATVYSQATKFSFRAENKQVVEVLRQIEEKSDFRFFFLREQVDVERKVTVTAREATVEQILDELFRGEPVSYEFANEALIVLTRSDNPLGSVNTYLQGNMQQPAVSGNVTEESGLPLPGVTVLIKGTTQGTVTNADGNYSLSNIPENATLQFSFVGMVTKEVVVGDQTNINIEMEIDAIGIEEVVAIGYGTMRKSDITGSVSQVKTEQLESVPVYNMEQALKGHSAGVIVTQNSGTPGGRIEVRIRGGNSMIGDNQPLYVVDGFPVTGGIDFLNPSDIESIDILKDASATAIYGSRGANGVVIITSKRGQIAQKGKIEFNSFYGIQQESNRYELLNAKQYAEVANELLKNEGLDPYFNLNEVQNPGTNWQDLIFRNAPIQNHTLTFSGSSESTRYSLSGNYYDQEGIILNSGVKRGSFRINLDNDINKWAKIGVNLKLARSQVQSVPVDNVIFGKSITDGALSAPPTLPAYDENGQYTRIENFYIFASPDMRNPLIYRELKDMDLKNSVLGNTTLEIQLAKGLSIKTLLGLEYTTSLGETFNPIIFSNDRGEASEGMTYSNSFLNENTINYSKTFNEIHSLNMVVGYTYQTNMYRYHNIGVSGFSNNITENYDLAAAETVNPPTSGISEWTLASMLGRINYSLNNKYLFTASVRADGSSRFGKENKWGYFPSGAFAWRISEESFMESLTFISDLKFRASYGATGNTALSPYHSLDRLSSGRHIYGDQQDEIGFVPSGIANQALKWETTTQLDVGFDLNLFANRLRFTFDYYKKNTTDLLASVLLPPSVGFTSILKNQGEIQNQGFEFSALADIYSGVFKWDISVQASTNQNKVIELAGNSDLYGAGIGHPFGNSNINIGRVGEPFGVFYGFVEDGLDEKGFVKYVDTNKDGQINLHDRVILGSPYPDVTFGVISNFSYKNFDLSLFFEGTYGNEVFWATSGIHLDAFMRGQNQFADLYGNYWTADNPNPNAKYPKISKSSAYTASDRFIKDGSYLRFKSAKFAYNLPVNQWKLSLFSDAQIYFSATNLFTITNYPGLDPEVNTRGSDDQNIGSRLRIGIDDGAYPNSKTYAVGLKLNF